MTTLVYDADVDATTTASSTKTKNNLLNITDKVVPITEGVFLHFHDIYYISTTETGANIETITLVLEANG